MNQNQPQNSNQSTQTEPENGINIKPWGITPSAIFWVGGQYLVELGVQGATELHVLHQVGALALVGGDDANLVRLGPSLEQLRGDFLHVGSFRPGEADWEDWKVRAQLSAG